MSTKTDHAIIDKRRSARIDTALAVVAVAGALALWWALSLAGVVNRVLLPSPADVFGAFISSVQDGTLWTDILASLLRVVEGFLLGFSVAVPVGMLMGNFRIFRGIAEPLVELVRPIPPIAIIPLAILWFGIGELSKVFIIAYGAFFPVLVNTIAGFREVDPVLIRAVRTLGASRWDIFRDVILRSAVPFIVVGARLGMGLAFIVLVAAELIASSEGLGFLINDARYNFRTDRMFLGMILIGALGFLLNKVLIEIERRLLRWRTVIN
jgi:ABC-type nitrate/sulfonate/bicarbonate transport system permease component